MKKQTSSFVETKKLFRETNTSNNTDHNGFEQRQQPRPLLHRSRHQDQPVQDLRSNPGLVEAGLLFLEHEGRHRVEVDPSEERVPLGHLLDGVGLLVSGRIHEPRDFSASAARSPEGRKPDMPSAVGSSAVSVVDRLKEEADRGWLEELEKNLQLRLRWMQKKIEKVQIRVMRKLKFRHHIASRFVTFSSHFSSLSSEGSEEENCKFILFEKMYLKLQCVKSSLL